MCATGAFAPFRLANRANALILTYHRFSGRDDGLATPGPAFEAQLKYLTAHDKIMPLTSIIEKLVNGTDLSSSAAITIDDGYCDAYEIAFPILVRYNVPATIYVTTDFVDRKAWLWTDKLRFLATRTRLGALEAVIGGSKLRLNMRTAAARLKAAFHINAALKTLPDESKDRIISQIASKLGVELPELPPEEFSAATWDPLREMESFGIEVGSHTLTHPILTNVSDDRLRRELQESRLRLEFTLGHPVTQFCYPNGTYDDRVKQGVAEAGYRCAVTTDSGFVGRKYDLLALHRIESGFDLPHFIKNVSGV